MQKNRSVAEHHINRDNNRQTFLCKLEGRRGENVKPDQPKTTKAENRLRESDPAAENPECQTISVSDDLLCILIDGQSETIAGNNVQS